MKKLLLTILFLTLIPNLTIGASYVVKPGDTTVSIARDNGVSTASISGFRSGDPAIIYPGEQLTINPELFGGLGAGDGTIGTLDPWKTSGGKVIQRSTSTPVIINATATTTASKLETPSFTVTGQALEGCAQFSSAGVLTSTGVICGTGGGGGGASSEWGVNGGNLYATTTATITDVILGGTTSSTADIILGKDGYGVFNEQSNDVDFRVESNGNAYAFFVDGTADSIGVMTQAPSTTLHVIGTFRTSGINSFDGAVNASSTLNVSGATMLQSTLYSIGAIRASSTLEVTGTSRLNGNTTLGGTLLLAGNATLNGTLNTHTIPGGTGTFALTSDLHNAVTLAGEDYLTLSTQQITAVAIDPDNLSASDFGDFTCNGTTCSLDATYLTANQSITLSGDVSGTGATAITTTIGSDRILESMLKAVDTASDEECLTYETTTGDFEWQSCGTGGGGGSSTDWIGSGSTLNVSSTYDLVNILATASSSQLRSPSSTLGTINGTIAFTGLVNSSSTFTSSAATVLGSTLHVGGAVNLASTLGVTGQATMAGINASGAINSSSTFTNSAATILGSTLHAGGAVNFASTLGVTGLSTVAGVNASGAVNASSTLSVSGATQLQSTLFAIGAVRASSTLEVTGQATLAGGIQLGGDIITDFSGTGLTVSGNSLQSTLGTSVDLTSEVTGILPIANGGTATSSIAANNGIYISNGSTWRNAVLPSCSDGTTSKLLYNSTTYTFTCGTDQSGSGGGSTTDWVGSGATLTASSTYTLVNIFGTASSTQLRSPSSTFSTSLIIPTSNALTTVGQIKINATTSTLVYYDGTAERGLTSGDCTLSYSYGTATTTRGIVLVSPRATFATSTVTNVYAVHGAQGDTATFNIFLTNNRSTATSSLRSLFTSYQTVTATTTASSLTVNGSTTINADDMMLIDFQPASSTDGSIAVCKRVNP